MLGVHIQKVDDTASLKAPEWQFDSHHDSQLEDLHHVGYLSPKDKTCLNKLEIPTIVTAVEG